MSATVRVHCAVCGEVAVPLSHDYIPDDDATRTVLAYVTAHEIDAHADELLEAAS